MTKAGRKRKLGLREPSGRLQRPTADKLNEMTAEKRRKEQQTVLDQPHRRGEAHVWAESPLGRLCLRYKLRHELYDAGLAYASIVSCWRGAKGIPRSSTRGDGGSCAEGPDQDAVARWNKQMTALEAALLRKGLDCLLAVRTLVLDIGDVGMDQTRPAIDGLLILAVELGLLRPFEMDQLA